MSNDSSKPTVRPILLFAMAIALVFSLSGISFFGPPISDHFYTWTREMMPQWSSPFVLKLSHLLRKAFHVLFYGVLAGLIWTWFERNFNEEQSGHYATLRCLFVLGGVLLIGIADETFQSLIPDRRASGLDLLYDVLGGIIAIFVMPILRTRKRNSMPTEKPQQPMNQDSK